MCVLVEGLEKQSADECDNIPTKHPLLIVAMRNTIRNSMQSSEVTIVLVPQPQNHLENTKQKYNITLLEHA